MKNYVKGLFLLGVLTFLYACQPEQDDGLIQETSDTSDLNLEVTTARVYYSEYSKNTQLLGETSRIMKSQNGNRSSDLGISIIEDQVLYIELGNYHSYTFKVDKQDALPLQNITFSINDTGDYDAFFVTYDITQEELDAINNGEALDLTEKTTIEDIDLDSTDFFNRSAASSSCSTNVSFTNCITVQTCDFGGTTHPAGDACNANGNADPPETFCSSISIISNCNGDGDGNPNTDDSDTSGDTGGGGASGNTGDTDEPAEETVPCESLPAGQGIEVGNGQCIDGGGLTGPFGDIDPTPAQILINHINANLDGPNLTDEQEQFLLENIEIANEILNRLQVSNGLEEQEYIRDIIEAGLNETLVTTFPLLKFPEGSNYEVDYPRLTEILQQKIPEMANNEIIVNAIHGITEAPIDIIVDALQWGKGATVIVEQLGGSGDTERYGAYRGHLDADLQDNLYIDIDLVNILEQSEDDTCFSIAIELLVAVTILHEYTHLGDFQFSEGFWNDLFLEEGGMGNEAGIVFEIDAFGEALYLDNVELYAQNNGLCD